MIIGYNIRMSKNPGYFVLSEICLVTQEYIAHKDQICCIKKIERPQGFITSSSDKSFKVWSRNGDLWGHIAITGENPVLYWKFPLDTTKDKEVDKATVMELMQSVESPSQVENDVVEFDDGEEGTPRARRKKTFFYSKPKRCEAKPDMSEPNRKNEEKRNRPKERWKK